MQTITIEGPLDVKNNKKINKLNNEIKDGKHVFLFLFMVGCGPCNMTKEPWSNIHKHLHEEHLKNPNIVVSMVDKDFYPKLHKVGKDPMGFPTLRYVGNGGVEDYESANIDKKDRSAESFAKWIKSKVDVKRGGTKQGCETMYLVPTKRRSGGGKWSLKYKRSINCRKPRGFSQKQHCKYGRKKTRKNKTRRNK